MKTIIVFLCVFILVSMGVQADVYVKGILHIDGGYRYGQNVPDIDVINEWWFGEKKVTFISKGWYLESKNPDWQIILNKEKKCIIVINLTGKSYVKVSLPMKLFNCVDQEIAERLETFYIKGSVKKIDKKETINKKECNIYRVTESISSKDDHFYERDRIVKATCDVPFDWRIFNELSNWIRSFFNPDKSYTAELKKIKGFIMDENSTLFELAGKVPWSSKVVEIREKIPPKNIYNIPKNLKRVQKFTYWDLVEIRLLLYPFPIY